MRTSRKTSLPEADRNKLERLVRARSTPQKVVLRAKIMLLGDDGVPTGEIRERLQTTVPTISRWRYRYEAAGGPGLLKDASRPGRKPSLSEATVAGIVELPLRERPPDATHWSTRRMAGGRGGGPGGRRPRWAAR